MRVWVRVEQYLFLCATEPSTECERVRTSCDVATGGSNIVSSAGYCCAL